MTPEFLPAYRGLIEGGRRILFGSRGGKRTRPKNLVLRPELFEPADGMRAALIARRIEDGLLAAGGTLIRSVRRGGSLMLIGTGKMDNGVRIARDLFEDVGIGDLRDEKVDEIRTETVAGKLDAWSPEILFVPSPIEDDEVCRAVTEYLGRPGRCGRRTTTLLYELRSPLLPNRVVDITEEMERKESLGEDLGEIDLFHTLNHYRSVTNMRGRGFAEAFISISDTAGTRGRDDLRGAPERLATYPIPFFEGVAVLNPGEIGCWEEGGPSGQRILVLSPHFDDETIGCGGTLLRHNRRGDQTAVLFFTDGREGDPRESDRDLVSAIRKQEAEEAASILGIGRLEFLDQPETFLRPDADLEERVSGIIDDLDPDIVYLPSFLENHIDHIELNRIFHGVLRRHPRELEIRMFGLWTVIPPNLVVDIRDGIEEKIRGVNAYRSQITQVDYLSVAIALNRYWSVRYGDGKGYMETYYTIAADAYCSIIESLGIDRGIG